MTPFAPRNGGTVSRSVSGSSASVALPSFSSQFRVYNSGSQVAYINFGDSNVTAATTDMPLPPGAIEVLSANNATHMAAIGTDGAIFVTAGFGV